MTVQTPSTNLLLQILVHLKSKVFTGRLVVRGKNDQEWYIYFCLGRIVYATGGNHTVRRWLRSLSLYCFAVDISQPNVFNRLTDTKKLSESEILQSWEYFLLVNWVNNQEISRKRVSDLIQAIILETLFDIHFDSHQTGDLQYEEMPEKELSPQMVLFDAEKVCMAAYQRWTSWQSDHLANIDPNQSPVIVKPDLMRQVMSEKAYESLETSLDGKRNLREISALTKRHEAKVSLSLFPYLRKGYLNLVDTPDYLSPAAKFFKDFHHSGSMNLGELVACVDDSLFVCEQMEEIFVGAGFQFVGISDSLRAVPTILARKPALIFLDLVMPNTNGYEICGYIRKVAIFRDTPIVILTGNDGIVDRVRAKMVGASDFLSKPVDKYHVLQIAHKYIKANSSGNFSKSSGMLTKSPH